ncbi:MAG: pyridoxal phosphate-dependent aminotransferase [Candidatus Brocadiia bacterium]
MPSRRMDAIGGSPTLAITAKVNELKKQGIDVIGFGAGEPDFPTPAPIVEAAITALRDGFTRYTASTGIPELRKAIVAKLERDNKLSYCPEQIIVTCGAKQAIYNAVVALCDEGDEAIVPVPYWVSYPEMVRLAGAKPVFVNTTEESGFKLTPALIEKAVSPRTRLLFLNSPNNPTGTALNRAELEQIGDFCAAKGIFIISDEIYEKLLYDGEHVSPASLKAKIFDVTITVNGVSKAYCMTGWRMGYCAAPLPIAKAISKIQDHTTSNITSFVQKACLAAFTLDEKVISDMRGEFHRRRDRMVELLNGLPGVTCRKPEGAFYAFAGIGGVIGKQVGGITVRNSMDFASSALEAARVAVVPGSAFGAENYVRLSYATSMANIEKGLARLQAIL